MRAKLMILLAGALLIGGGWTPASGQQPTHRGKNREVREAEAVKQRDRRRN